MSELPNGWAEVSLGEIAVWGSGGTPSRKNPDYYGGTIPWIKTGELGDRVVTDTEEKITEKGLQSSSAKLFPKGSVAIAMYGATIGKVSILGIDATTNQACAVAQPIHEATDTEFLYWLLRNEKEAFIAKGKGGAQPNISQEIIKEHLIGLPPLNEQKRIADKLDRLLARVDAAKARLDKIPPLLKRLRQAILAAATTGKLTEEWREHSGKSDEWPNVKLSDVAKSRLGKMLDKSKNQGNPTPYLRNINVRWFDFDLSDIQLIQVRQDEIADLQVARGDVLICEGGEPGRCAVWQGEDNVYVYQKALHRVRVGSSLLSEWLCYCLKDSADSGRLEEYFTGTTIKHFTGIALSGFEFPLPSLEEQKEITRRVEELFAIADRIEAQYRTARARVDRLTQSLLAKAFKGELVPQDPSDEPAAALLERIRAQRSAAPKPKRGRRKQEETEELPMVAEPKTKYRKTRKTAS